MSDVNFRVGWVDLRRTGQPRYCCYPERESAVEPQRVGNLRIGVVGDFYPHTLRSAHVTTGIAILASEADVVQNVRVYGPEGSRIPTGLSSESCAKISLTQSWKIDSPFSIVRLGYSLLRDSKSLDGIVFNTILRTYGANAISNGLGLLLPTIVARVTRKPVLVYCHSLLETQDNRALGFEVKWPTIFLVRILERMMLGTSKVVVRLGLQARKVQEFHGVEPPHFAAPFVDAVSSFYASKISQRETIVHRNSVSVLVFGIGGPHKDIVTVVRALSELERSGTNACLTLAGGIAIDSEIQGLLSKSGLEGASCTADLRSGCRIEVKGPGLNNQTRLVPNVEECEVANLFRGTDVVVLPYLAAGGFSSVMCQAAFYGARIIAYDLPEFRETAASINCEVELIPPGDATAMATAISRSSPKSREDYEVLPELERERLNRARRAVASLIGYLLRNMSPSQPSEIHERKL